jgi:AraC-like DNA-binding protein
VRIKKVQNRSAFHMEMSGVHLDQTMVGYNQFATETLVDPGEVGDSIFLVLGVGAPATIHVDGESLVCSEKGAILSPSRRVIFDLPAGSGTLTVKAKFDTIEKRFQEVLDRHPGKSIRYDRSANLANGLGAQVRGLLGSLVDTIEQNSAVLGNSLLRGGFDDMLLNIFLALPNNYSDELLGNHRPTVAPALVHTMEEFLEAHATEPITISDLVAQCECSRAALFNAFRRYRDYTPMQFLAECRLKSARDALQSPSPADSVSSIAYACGFSHLGRFTANYSRRFGESPSETLRKARPTVGA